MSDLTSYEVFHQSSIENKFLTLFDRVTELEKSYDSVLVVNKFKEKQIELFYPEKGELPDENEFVCAYFPNRNSTSKDVHENHKWDIVKCMRGISKEDRLNMHCNDPRKTTYCFADEDGNNERPYRWDTFGPSDYFGQECEKWFRLPNGKE